MTTAISPRAFETAYGKQRSNFLIQHLRLHGQPTRATRGTNRQAIHGTMLLALFLGAASFANQCAADYIIDVTQQSETSYGNGVLGTFFPLGNGYGPFANTNFDAYDSTAPGVGFSVPLDGSNTLSGSLSPPDVSVSLSGTPDNNVFRAGAVSEGLYDLEAPEGVPWSSATWSVNATATINGYVAPGDELDYIVQDKLVLGSGLTLHVIAPYYYEGQYYDVVSVAHTVTEAGPFQVTIPIQLSISVFDPDTSDPPFIPGFGFGAIGEVGAEIIRSNQSATQDPTSWADISVDGNLVPTVQIVPEPSCLVLLASGIGLIGVGLRMLGWRTPKPEGEPGQDDLKIRRLK